VLTHVARASATDEPCGTKVSSEDGSLFLSSHELRARVTLVDRQTAQRLFKDMHALACDPVHINRTCTPFAYVIDGCMERAHQMCEQLHKAGVEAGKVWLRSSSELLAPESANCPDCFAGWDFHVAPVLRVQIGAGDEWRVIDPSLFAPSAPLPTIGEWRARQRNEQAQFFFTEARVYQKQLSFLSDPDILDPNFLCSPKTLRALRAKLAAQVAKNGPPPYCSL
jgi:hypothetical protein